MLCKSRNKIERLCRLRRPCHFLCIAGMVTHQKTEMREIERVQQKATTWILNYSIGYKERLRTLKILPLSMYIELHDTLFLQWVMDGKYSVSEDSIPISLRESTTRQCSEFELNKNRISKTDENFWTRAPKTFQYTPQTVSRQPDEKTTDRKLLQLLWKQLQWARHMHLACTVFLWIV